MQFKNIKIQPVKNDSPAFRMQEAGVRPSLQRLAVFEYLCTHYNHPTVDTIYAELHPEMPTLSRTTVYNTLRILCRAGLVSSLNIDYQNQRFDGHTHAHDHFICSDCGKVFDIPAVQEQRRVRPDMPDFEIARTEVSYFGLCPECRRRVSDRSKKK